MIKAIETKHKGYNFRSRLEARWAVFFDALGIKWEYEKEGFDLGAAGWYLPDFWLPDLGIWVEIKPGGGDESELFDGKWLRFACAINAKVVLLCGLPDVMTDSPGDCSYRGFIAMGEGGDCDYFWCECSECGAIGIQYCARSERNRHTGSCSVTMGHKNYNGDSERIRAAVAAARSARFEHGQRGQS